MNRLLMSLMILITLFCMWGCDLVVQEGTTADGFTRTDKPLAVKIQVTGEEAEYDQIYYSSEVDELPHSKFLGKVHINVYGDNKEIITGEYYLDRDTSSCVTLSYLFYSDNAYTESEKETFCEDQAAITYSTKNYSHEFKVKLVDVDYLESLEIIEFNDKHERLKTTSIDLTAESVEVNLTHLTYDFIISEKYRDSSGNVYYKRTLHYYTEVAKTPYPSFHYYSVVGLTENNERFRIDLRFGVNGEEETV